MCDDSSVHADQSERSCVLIRAFTQGDSSVHVLWGMGYRMERRRRGGNIAGGGADRRNPRIATPQPIEPRSGGKRSHTGIASRANIILYIGIYGGGI